MLLTQRIPLQLDPRRLMRALENQWSQSFVPWIETALPTPAVPHVRLWTKDGTAVVEFDLPGSAPELISVSVLGDTLTVEASQEQEGAPEGTVPRVREREPLGRRDVSLPFTVDPQSTVAEYTRGVLRVTVSQPAAERPTRIEVKGN